MHARAHTLFFAFKTYHFFNQVRFMPYSGDCHVISCARDGQVRLAELSLTGVCKATRKLAQHRGAAHKVDEAGCLCWHYSYCDG